jgi:hypothetical protein
MLGGMFVFTELVVVPAIELVSLALELVVCMPVELSEVF